MGVVVSNVTSPVIHVFLPYPAFIKGNYAIGLFFFLAGTLPLITICLDTFLFKELCFYSDKVTKSWSFFGVRTIYYSKARIFAPVSFLKLFNSANQIKETDDYGKTLSIQMPIIYLTFFFKKAQLNQIIEIINYLTDNSDDNPRLFKKNTLSEENLNYVWNRNKTL